MIKNLQDLFQIYVYSDIAKNPPNSIHEKIDVDNLLSKISTKNRYFYEFYQEIKIIIDAFKDLHSNIIAAKTPKEVSFAQYIAHLPFFFRVRRINGNFRIVIV